MDHSFFLSFIFFWLKLRKEGTSSLPVRFLSFFCVWQFTPLRYLPVEIYGCRILIAEDYECLFFYIYFGPDTVIPVPFSFTFVVEPLPLKHLLSYRKIAHLSARFLLSSCLLCV